MALNFIAKRARNISDKDISITATNYRSERNSFYIVFRNNSDKQIGHTGFISVAMSGERLYFKEADETFGYKVRKNNSKSSVMTRIKHTDLYEWAVTHSGDYMLKFDRTIALYYVDTE